MKQYSFLNEGFAKDIFDVAKMGGKAAVDNVKSVADNVSKKHPSIYKVANIGIGVGSASYSYYLAVLNALMAKKIDELIKSLNSPEIDTRTKAVALFINLAYTDSELASVEGIKSITVNNGLSSKVAGPAIQIIKNPVDANWKEHVIKYLKRQKVFMIAKASVEPVIGTVAGIGVSKYLKK